MTQLHKKFTDGQVKELLGRYLRKEIERSYIQEILGIGKVRFFALLKKYRGNPSAFSIQYERRPQAPRISPEAETNILKQLRIDKGLIENKDIPIHRYNYSYVQHLLETKYKQKVSAPTIIARAKEHGYYIPRRKRAAHDREVLTHYAGELIQHDTSFHLWAPAADEKWYLITSLDDFSRLILYAVLIKQETSWAHIQAAESVFLKYGLPFSYYVDSHSIFRFVQGRDSFHREHHLQTDDIAPQWKQVLGDCNVKVIHALSPQAKGKIERPYQWIQDRLVRTCVRENVTQIAQGQFFLNQEIRRYNYRQVHSTIGEVPYFRFQTALKERSLFREFKVKPPYQSLKDIFCFRLERIADGYRKISINNRVLPVHADPGDTVNVRIYHVANGVSELRCWSKGRLIDLHRLKTTELEGVQF